MKKELRPFHDVAACDVCGRTILKGERTEPYLAPGGIRNAVCELCFVRAEHAGWIREAAADAVPTRGMRQEPRRPLLGRLRRRRDDPPYEEEPPGGDPFTESAARNGGEPEPPQPAPAEAPPRRRGVPQDPRHVRAVPTTAEVKIERALDLFNGSDHQRTVAGLTRSLGLPWVTAVPDAAAPSTVTLVVAWELSWYRYRIDLGDASDPIALLDKGDELDDLGEDMRDWNAALDATGNVVIGVEGQ